MCACVSCVQAHRADNKYGTRNHCHAWWVVFAGTDKESKSPPNGRASGTVRRSTDGGKTWTSVVLNGKEAYSYSCLSKMPESAFVGLAWETVLPGSGVPATWSANNIVFTRIPQNFTASPQDAS